MSSDPIRCVKLKSYSDVREEEICPSRHNEQPDIQLSEEINVSEKIHVVAANKPHKNKSIRLF